MKILRYFLLSILFFPVVAAAHGDRPSFEKTVNGYLVDIGYDRVGIRPDEPVKFDFDIFTQSGALAFVPFTDVQVSIEKEGKTLATQTAKNETVNVPVITMTFPSEGAYVMHVDFHRDGISVVQTSFDIPVSASNGWLGRSVNMITYIVATVLILVALYTIVRSFRRRAS